MMKYIAITTLIAGLCGCSSTQTTSGQQYLSKYKEAPNRNTNYASLESGLVAVRGDLCSKMIDINDPVSLGLPLIGCGLAGGDWKGVVKPMIKELFENSGVDVTVFVLEKDLHLIK